MTEQHLWLNAAGGGRIFCRVWLPDTAAGAVLQIAHGLSEHSGRYAHLAAYLAAHRFAVVAADHTGHGHSDGVPGCFTGGWWSAVEDLRRVARRCRLQWPDAPLFLLGHSMGSFLVRTLLIDHPELPLTGVLLSGSAQYPRGGTAILGASAAVEAALRGDGADSPAVHRMQQLLNLPFRDGSPYAWVSGDPSEASELSTDPLCNVPPTLGLQRDMLKGIVYNQKPEHLARMRKDLPVLFFSGDQDPVGLMGHGVLAACASFRRAGLTDVHVRLYPGARHETLHESCRDQVFRDLLAWMEAKSSGPQSGRHPLTSGDSQLEAGQ